MARSTCSKCGLPYEEGHTHCKPCVNAYARKYREENREKIRAKDRVRNRTPERLAYNRSLNAKRTPEQREQYRLNSLHWSQENREKRHAHSHLWYAIQTGRVVKEPCEVCGTEENIHGHHEDYSKKFDVIWLCREHHLERHRIYESEV